MYIRTYFHDNIVDYKQFPPKQYKVQYNKTAGNLIK